MTACHPGNDPFQSDPYSHNIFFCHRRNPSHQICMVFTSPGSIKKDNEEDEEEKKNCHDHEYCLIHSLLPPGCRSPDVCTAHSCARHCQLHFIQGPFSFCSPVSCRTPRATWFGFPRRLFPACVNHSLSDSRPCLHYRGAVTEYEPDFLITATPRNLNPVRKRPPSVGRSQIQELID